MFYSNGFESFIWDDQFYKQARPVFSFYTKKELQTVMFRRPNRKDIRDTPIDLNITDRHVSQNGRIDPVKLFDPPFNRFHPHGIEGVFKPEMASRLIDIVKRINQSQITG